MTRDDQNRRIKEWLLMWLNGAFCGFVLAMIVFGIGRPELPFNTVWDKVPVIIRPIQCDASGR